MPAWVALPRVRGIMKRWAVSPFACFADVHLTHSQQNKQMEISSTNKLPFIFLKACGRILELGVCVCVCISDTNKHGKLQRVKWIFYLFYMTLDRSLPTYTPLFTDL